jgi:hypothetical protein
MASSVRGELVWTRRTATAPHWVLVLDGPPDTALRWLEPPDPFVPQAATGRALAELISRTLYNETGHCPEIVTLTPVTYRQRFRFHAVTY